MSLIRATAGVALTSSPYQSIPYQKLVLWRTIAGTKESFVPLLPLSFTPYKEINNSDQKA